MTEEELRFYQERREREAHLKMLPDDYAQLTPKQQRSLYRHNRIATLEEIRPMLEEQGWTIMGMGIMEDDPYHGHVSATRGDVHAMYYFHYHTLEDIEYEFQRMAGEVVSFAMYREQHPVNATRYRRHA